MKKLLICMLFMVASAFAIKPLVLEICNPNFCYEQVIPDAKKWEIKHDFTGKKFIRVYFYDTRKLLDISAEGRTVKQLKVK